MELVVKEEYVVVTVYTCIDGDTYTTDNILSIPETLKFIADNYEELNEGSFFEISSLDRSLIYNEDDVKGLVH